MDSGNSSSMQSSSGGDEEYDSRPHESLPAFLNTSSHFDPLSSNPHPSLVSHTSIFFDPSSNYLNPFSQSQPNNSSLLNLDGVRPLSLRSQKPNSSTDLGNLPAGSSGSSNSMLGAQQGGLNQGSSFPSSSSMLSRPANHENGARSLTQSDQPTTGVVKNPKKRTRASRRAPTTVLTTDTTNFRAMVQEFTGVPAQPFSSSSYCRRLDLFGSGSSGMRSSHLEPLGSLYPLRPAAKRIQPTPFVSSSSSASLLNNNPLVDAANITNISSTSTIPSTSIAATNNAFNPTSSSNYQLPSDLGLLKQTQNMLNLQTQGPVLSFQSFLQPPALHPSLNLPGFGVKSQGSSAMASLNDELGISTHGHVNANLGGGIQSHVTADGPRLRSDSSNWRDGIGLNDGNLDGNYGNDHHQNSQRVNNSCKLNYSAAASSDYHHHHHHDKGLENVSSRAEGTVDSWICPAE